jgi:hypothetical protein
VRDRVHRSPEIVMRNFIVSEQVAWIYWEQITRLCRNQEIRGGNGKSKARLLERSRNLRARSQLGSES